MSNLFGGTRSNTSTAQTSTNTQRTQSLENVGTNVSDIEGDVEFNQQVTDQGAIQGAVDIAGRALQTVEHTADESFGFARDVSTQSNQVSRAAVDTLSSAITRVGDATRSDTTETFRRVALYAAIAVAVIFGARYLRRS